MARLFKYLHVVATIGLVGSLAAVLVLALGAAGLPSEQALVMFRGMAWIVARVALPSIALLWLSGLLAIAVRTAFLEMGWMWAKVVIGMAVTGIVLISLWPGSDAMTALDEPATAAALQALAATLARETGWAWAAVSLGLIATAFGLWRPKLPGFTVGGPEGRSS